MATGREEAAPTFSTWKRRLGQVDISQTRKEVQQFVEVLRAIGTPMIDGLEVHFVYCNPRSNQVQLAGEFNQWGSRGRLIKLKELGKTGVFYHTLKLKSPGRLEYKFIVDGKWQTDPLCAMTVDNGVGDKNSAFIVGDLKDPPELQTVPGIAHGRVEKFEFYSRRLGNHRQIYAYLPAAYDKFTVQRFSTQYVHDGGEYLDRSRFAIVMDNLIAKSDIPPLIVVLMDPVNRMLEYRANQPYADFLAREFVPAIDARYRTIADRDSRAVMGASLGGLISIYTALRYPAIFSRVAGQSSALQLAEVPIASLLSRVKQTSFRWYLDVGEYEPSFIPAHDRFVGVLKKRRWAFFYQRLPAGHNWTSWRAHLKDLLAFLWAADSQARHTSAMKRDE
jgi:enterochelin esterase-like enzyme